MRVNFKGTNLASKAVTAVVATTLVLGASMTASALTIFDGFGDGDRNNDGVIDLLDSDTNWNGANDPGEITTAEDPSDVGITWFGSRGFSGDNNKPKQLGTIFNDTPEGLGEDYALHLEAAGSGSSSVGVFGQSVTIGPNVGDKVVAEVDFRIWTDSPNPTPPPAAGQLRWGLWQDTDAQLGLSDNQGPGGASAVWGKQDGEWFDNSPGAEGDKGLYARVPIGVLSTVDDSRHIYEYNLAGINGTSNNGRFFEGSGASDTFGSGGDTQTVAQPTSDGPGGKIGGDLATDPSNQIPVGPHRLRIEVERSADGLIMSSFVDDVLSLRDTVKVPDARPYLGTPPDSFDYVAFRNTNPSGGQGDWDFVLDNFSISSVSIPEPASAALLGLAGVLLVVRRRR